MSKAHGLALGLALFFGFKTLPAQETPTPTQQNTVPLRQAQPSTEFSDGLVPAPTPAADLPLAKLARDVAAKAKGPSLAPPAATFSWSVEAYRPAMPVIPRSPLSGKYLLWNGLHLGMAVFDVEMTQRCIANHHCREGNPIMPSSRGAQIGVSLGAVAYAAGTSYWLRKHHSRFWWTAPVAGIVTHTVGVASGFAHR